MERLGRVKKDSKLVQFKQLREGEYAMLEINAGCRLWLARHGVGSANMP